TSQQPDLAGDPTVAASTQLPDCPSAHYAESLGLKGIRLDNPDQVAMAWEEAMDADCPVVIDAITDPEVPPLPPHITVRQARNLVSALVYGDANAGQIVRQSYRDMIENFLPHKNNH